MPGVDWLPGVSQVKSFCQLVTGDIDGAARTQKNFAKECPGVSQITSAVQFISGDTEGAIETQLRCLGTVNNMANGVPVVGHIKGGVHHMFGDHEGGKQALQAANRSSVVLGTGVAVGLASGGFAAIPAAMVAGSTYDVADSLISDKPKGVFAAVQAAVDNPNAGTIFDATACYAADALAGYSGGQIGKQIATHVKINSLKVVRDVKTEQLTAAMGAEESSVNSMTSGQFASLGEEINALTRKIDAKNPTLQYYDPKTNQMIGSKTTGGGKPIIAVNVSNEDDIYVSNTEGIRTTKLCNEDVGSNIDEAGLEYVTALTRAQRKEKQSNYVQQEPGTTTLTEKFPNTVTNKTWDELKEYIPR